MPNDAGGDEARLSSIMLNTSSNSRQIANYSVNIDGSSVALSPRESESSNSPTRPRPKRRKVRLACRACRRRKTRCDGTLPICQACTSRGVGANCVYVNVADDLDNDSSPQIGKTTKTTKLKEVTSSHQAQSLTRGHGAQDTNQYSTSPVSRPLSATVGTTRDSLSTPQDHEHQFDRGTDALATVTSNPTEDNLVYGGSSMIAFVRSFTHGATEQNRHPNATGESLPQEHQPPNDRQVSTQPVPILERDPASFLLPTRRAANDYIQCFWEFIHPLFPVLHKTSFMAKYSHLWSVEDGRDNYGDISDISEVIFASTLNLVFAIGCQFSGSVPPQNKVSLADDFYQRSRKIFVYDILDSTSVGLVQMLLVSGIYLQSTKYASRCWNVVGLGIRTAQSLGLHIDMTKYRPENQINREMGRRIWHTCLVLDKLLAMTFGRPTMISNNWDAPMPALIDDEYLLADGEGTQPPDIPCRIGLLVSSSNLFAIMHDILASLYSENLRNNLNEILQDDIRVREMISGVLLLNRRLESFVDTVPEYIRGALASNRVPKDQSTSVQIQEQVLFCRYLYTRVLLLRPILLLASKRRFTIDSASVIPASLDVELVRSCCNLCIRTAQSLIECLHQHLHTTYRSSGWHSVYFAFAAGSILLVGLHCPIVDEDSIRPSFEISWHRCLTIMEHHKQQIQSAPRAMQALKSLRAQLDSQVSEARVNVAGAPDVEQTFPQFDFSQFNPDGTDFIDDTWFSQHIINLDWLETS